VRRVERVVFEAVRVEMSFWALVSCLVRFASSAAWEAAVGFVSLVSSDGKYLRDVSGWVAVSHSTSYDLEDECAGWV
jgi:hypothetical protein